MMFMLAGRADWVRMVGEFEAINDLQPSSTGHHEEGRSLQGTFRKDISHFVKVVGQLAYVSTIPQSCGKSRILTYFPHFCQNVPHFWLNFEMKKLSKILTLPRQEDNFYVFLGSHYQIFVYTI